MWSSAFAHRATTEGDPRYEVFMEMPREEHQLVVSVSTCSTVTLVAQDARQVPAGQNVQRQPNTNAAANRQVRQVSQSQYDSGPAVPAPIIPDSSGPTYAQIAQAQTKARLQADPGLVNYGQRQLCLQ